MDGYREHPGDFEPAGTGVPVPAPAPAPMPAPAPAPAASAASEQDVAAAIGSDERRMHVRAYNYWVSLLGGRDFPSIEDLEPGSVSDFAANSVLLDFTCGGDDPATPYIGAAIREECGLGAAIRTISDVPSRSLLSRLTDHYMQIIANRAPVGFEAEFVNQRGQPICYRGILMPFSSDGDTIDFIYGVINWKQSSETADTPFVPRCDEALEAARQADVVAIAGLGGEDVEAVEEANPLPAVELGADAGLADRLWAARECAAAAKAADGRTRAALYRALAEAYDFAVAARENPCDYAELLEDSGLKAQARAPMTPIAKLVFGSDYDKTRLTEFAAALAHAERLQVARGGFLGLIEAQPGGLKALVAAERQARRPEPRTDTASEAARGRLRSAAAVALASLEARQEFGLVLARRSPDGGFEAIALIDDPALVERAIRRAA